MEEKSEQQAAGGGPMEASDRVERAYRFRDLSAYTFKERLVIRAAGLVFYVLVRLVGRSTRFRVEGWENWEAASRDGHLPIYTCWHDQIFLGTYFWRRRGIIFMSSLSFDAEYTARMLQRFGYGVAKGSSTRGGVGGLIEMIRLMRAGCPAGFTIDGPKGPRHVAKMGAVLLAKKTGNPVLPFAIAPARRWEAKSWDVSHIPKPFTRALVSIAPPILVPPDADEATLNARRDELQRALDDLEKRGNEWRNAKGGRRKAKGESSDTP